MKWLSVILHEAPCHNPEPDEFACPHSSLVESVNQMQEHPEFFVGLFAAVLVASLVAYVHGQYVRDAE